ncbi:MAG: SRPBCC family protein [Candidatus Ranarchaeia archaeon]
MSEDYSKDTRLVKIVEIEAPLELVWTLIADLERIPEFDARFKDIKFLTSQKKGIGTLTYWKASDKDGRTRDRVEMITEYKPLEYYSYTVLKGAKPKDCTFIFQRIPNGTRIIYTAHFKYENPDIKHYGNAAMSQLEETRKAALRIMAEGRWPPAKKTKNA